MKPFFIHEIGSFSHVFLWSAVTNRTARGGLIFNVQIAECLKVVTPGSGY